MVTVSDELRRALEADDPEDLEKIIHGRRKEHFQALMDLVSAGSDVNPQYRTRAVFAMGRWGDPSAVAAIQRVLTELDELGRVTAVDALGRLGTREALAAILERAEDFSPNVRKSVARALGRINEPEAREKLSDVERGDPERFVREVAAKSRRRLEQNAR
ncbi:MAG: HEAT repeat domain-containing protein [Dehalococcoidia bacterium]